MRDIFEMKGNITNRVENENNSKIEVFNISNNIKKELNAISQLSEKIIKIQPLDRASLNSDIDSLVLSCDNILQITDDILQSHDNKLDDIITNDPKLYKQLRVFIHNIKNCLNSVYGFSCEMKDEDDINIIKRYAQIINSANKDAQNMVDDFIKYLNNPEVENEKLNLSNFKLDECVDSFIALSKQQAKNKGIDLSVEIKNEGQSIFADQELLKNVFRNLISNAIKFTSQGGHIKIYNENQETSVKIYIKDDGVGIAKERIEKFFNSPGVTTLGTDGEKGTGIGVHDCFEVLEKMNGKIEVESEGEGKGTTVILTLPKGKE